MKTIGAALLILFTFTSSFGYLSGIAIQSEQKSNMQVYVNGKLYNKHPGNFVRIPSKPGLFHLRVKVLNPFDKEWYMIRKDIRVEKGYEFYYKVIFKKGFGPRIQELKRYPVYSTYFLNASFYNRHPIS